MHVEVSVALNFVISYLYNKLPRRRVDMFGEELEKGLKKRFEGHWYPDKPFKGSGFRCVKVTGQKMDILFMEAAISCGLDMEEIKSYLPQDLTLWIDPNEVSYKIGEKGQIKILYSDRKADDEVVDREVQATNRGFNPDAQCFKPIDGLSASLGSLNISPGSVSPSTSVSPSNWPIGPVSQSTSPSVGLFSSSQSSAAPSYPPKQGSIIPMFTTATFAQTKFGSTKLKTNAKRPTRLSPTDFGNYFRQKTVTLSDEGLISPSRSRSLSPRDPRVEFLIDQQQRMMQQQQQHQQQYQLQQQQLQQLNYQLQQSQLHQQPPQSQMGLYGDIQRLNSHSPQISATFPVPTASLDFQAGVSPLHSPMSSPLTSPVHSPMNSVSRSAENHKPFIEGLNLSKVPYSNQCQHLLMAN
ncbi:hypothetical protein ACJMK2_034023 [Sinanodonta woodiana]|uniref:Anti-proliferative protein domain-containing protein n=1 Tax=Sinanodonta woodiana TaxID=1069815 RepID=A0ABD3WRR4_SINWO